jgi:hypothetical protein
LGIGGHTVPDELVAAGPAYPLDGECESRVGKEVVLREAILGEVL